MSNVVLLLFSIAVTVLILEGLWALAPRRLKLRQPKTAIGMLFDNLRFFMTGR